MVGHTDRANRATTLPPGQRRAEGFPRFGTHLHRPPPPVPPDATITIAGVVTAATAFPVSELATLPRAAMTADFHCVAGWSATGLHWEGVAFADFYRVVVAPVIAPHTRVTHLVFGGADGYRSVVEVDDAFGADVMIADRLDGRPLDGQHGAPARLVSPQQYGFVSAKHLSLIEVHDHAPAENFGAASPLARLAFHLPVFRRHPRARVWREERHPYLPARVLRPVYRLFIEPIRAMSAR